MTLEEIKKEIKHQQNKTCPNGIKVCPYDDCGYCWLDYLYPIILSQLSKIDDGEISHELLFNSKTNGKARDKITGYLKAQGIKLSNGRATEIIFRILSVYQPVFYQEVVTHFNARLAQKDTEIAELKDNVLLAHNHLRKIYEELVTTERAIDAAVKENTEFILGLVENDYPDEADSIREALKAK